MGALFGNWNFGNWFGDVPPYCRSERGVGTSLGLESNFSFLGVRLGASYKTRPSIAGLQ